MKFKFDNKMKFFITLIVIATVLTIIYPYVSTEGEFSKVTSKMTTNLIMNGVVYFAEDMPLDFRYVNSGWPDPFSNNYYIAMIYNNESDYLNKVAPVTQFTGKRASVSFTWKGVAYPSDFNTNSNKYSSKNFDFYVVIYKSSKSTPKYVTTYKVYQFKSLYKASKDYTGSKCGSVCVGVNCKAVDMKCKLPSGNTCFVQTSAKCNCVFIRNQWVSTSKDGSGWCTTGVGSTTPITTPIPSTSSGSARVY